MTAVAAVDAAVEPADMAEVLAVTVAAPADMGAVTEVELVVMAADMAAAVAAAATTVGDTDAATHVTSNTPVATKLTVT